MANMEMFNYSKFDSSENFYEESAGGFKAALGDGSNTGEQSSSAYVKTSASERDGGNDAEGREPTHTYSNHTNDVNPSASTAEVKRSAIKCSKFLCLTISVLMLLIGFASSASYVTYLTVRLSALEKTVIERLNQPLSDQYQGGRMIPNTQNINNSADARARIQDLEDILSSQMNDTRSHSTTIVPEVQMQTYEDCQAAWERGNRVDGVYRLSPGQLQPFNACCKFEYQHGWTVIQRRLDGSINFYLPWDSYKRGFGNPLGEYWLGNEKIFSLTRRNRKLSIYLMRWDGDVATANYSNFYISNETDNYRLNISGYTGNTGHDSMAHSKGYQFSTWDRDNDALIGAQCADHRKGAWWFNVCAESNLNGVYTNSSTGDITNMWWGGDWSGGAFRPLRRTTIMITRD